MNWLALLQVVLPYAATAAGLWIAHRFTSPKDHERAALLSMIAGDAAAAIYAANPNAAWADMVRDVVARLAAAAGVPTNNATALENAASAALLKLGAKPAGMVTR